MIYRIIIAIIVFVHAAISLNGQGYGDLKITITDIRSDKGYFLVGLYEEHNYLDLTGFTKADTVKASMGSVTAVFEQLPPGEYAIALIHDENNSGDMNLNLIGIPKEPYGFSNNPNKLLSKPKFRHTKFTKEEDELNITIDLYHW